MEQIKINQQVIENFIQKHGKKASQILSALGKSQPFIEAIQTNIGQELLKDALEMIQERLDKIINEEATELEKAEYRVLRTITTRWVDKINNHTKLLSEVYKEGKIA